MRCADVMTPDVVFVRATDDVATANRTMKSRRVGFLPVCDDAGLVVGFVTDQHITRVVVTEDIGPSTPVEVVMGRDVTTCSPEDDVSVAESAIASHPGRCAVCVGPRGELVGVVGATDLTRATSHG